MVEIIYLRYDVWSSDLPNSLQVSEMNYSLISCLVIPVQG